MSDPLIDRERLQEIADLDLLGGDVDEGLDAIARRAATELGLPIGLVSIVLDEAQYFAAQHGLTGMLAETRGTPVEWAFCSHAVRAKKPFVTSDATSHPLTRDTPLVQDGIRCYAGIPLVTSKGHAIGTLCVIGTVPRPFPDEDLAVLEDLAAQVVERIEARRRR